MFNALSVIIIIIINVICGAAGVNQQPQQVHLALGETDDQISVTWVTIDYVKESIVQYGFYNSGDLNFTKIGGTDPKSPVKFIDGGTEKRTQYIHRVVLTNLKPLTKYAYRCGSPHAGWSPEFHFTTKSPSFEWTPRMAIYGDLGNEQGISFPLLQRLAQNSELDAIVHLGDFAYNFQDDNGRVGDSFMRQLEPVAAYVPYMTVVGNHEYEYDFAHYKSRFFMPGNTENMYYSFNMGPIHFLVFSTEHYYFPQFNQTIQFEWIANDLRKANRNRKSVPWIVILGHRPMYCTNLANEGCINHETKIRTGDINATTAYALEPLFYKYGVDLAFWGHEHSYERFWPAYDFEVLNGTGNDPYVNARAPVHIISGAAGCKYPEIVVPTTDMSAIRLLDYGFTMLYGVNETHLRLEHIGTLEERILDSFWMVKDNRNESEPDVLIV